MPFITADSTPQLGLCFLPLGAASIFGALFSGRLVDSEFRRLGGTKGASVPPDFPIEKARLRIVPPFLAVCVCMVILFGWTTGHTSLAAPLVFNFPCELKDDE